MSILFSADMTGIYFIIGFLHQKYLWQNKEGLNLKKINLLRVERNIQYIIAVWFLISVLIEEKFRFIFWWGMVPLILIYRIWIANLR